MSQNFQSLNLGSSKMKNVKHFLTQRGTIQGHSFILNKEKSKLTQQCKKLGPTQDPLGSEGHHLPTSAICFADNSFIFRPRTALPHHCWCPQWSFHGIDISKMLLSPLWRGCPFTNSLSWAFFRALALPRGANPQFDPSTLGLLLQLRQLTVHSPIVSPGLSWCSRPLHVFNTSTPWGNFYTLPSLVAKMRFCFVLNIINHALPLLVRECLFLFYRCSASSGPQLLCADPEETRSEFTSMTLILFYPQLFSQFYLTSINPSTHKPTQTLASSVLSFIHHTQYYVTHAPATSEVQCVTTATTQGAPSEDWVRKQFQRGESTVF